MQRRTIFERMLEGVSRVAILPSVGEGGTTIVADGGGGGSAASPSPSTPSGGGDGSGTSGSPAPAPAATPSPDSAPSEGAPPPEASDPWAGLGLDPEPEDSVTIPAQPAATAAPAPAQHAAPTPPAQPQPVQQTPPATPEPAAQAAAPAQPQAVMPSPAEPAALAAFMLDPANSQRIVDHLANERYKLTDAEMAELADDASIAVPKLLAKSHLQITASVMRFIEQSVPQLLQKHTKVSEANKAAETQFFGAVKGLDANNKAHREAAGRVVAIYRQMNPNATMEQVIQICAPMVLQAVGSSPAAAPTPQGVPPAPAPRPVPAAFQPAIGAGGAQPAPTETDPWGGLGRTMDEDD